MNAVNGGGMGTSLEELLRHLCSEAMGDNYSTAKSSTEAHWDMLKRNSSIVADVLHRGGTPKDCCIMLNHYLQQVLGERSILRRRKNAMLAASLLSILLSLIAMTIAVAALQK